MIEIRATTPDEYRAASAVVSTALMHAPASDEDWEKSIPSWQGSDSIGAWDGDRCVGHMAGYRFETIVPGGARVPTNGVTRVGVLPTHRRTGLARQLMTRLLTEARQRGQVLASLRASEADIYPRFGFGLAGQAAEMTLDPRAALPIRGAATDGSLRLLRHDEVIATVVPIYEQAARRPGVLVRPEWMWQRFFEKATVLGGDAEFVVVHTNRDGVDDGYVHYSVDWKTEHFTSPTGKGEVYEVWATEPAAELALWEYLCNVDLVREWYADERPVDELLSLAVHDLRAYRSMWRWDEQWLRLLDVDAALAARTYEDVDGSVTIAVTDGLLPANDGVYEVSAAGAKRATLDAADADLAVGIADLSAAYLGGTWWSHLADAGRVGVRSAAGLDAADRLFVTRRAPFCNSGF